MEDIIKENVLLGTFIKTMILFKVLSYELILIHKIYDTMSRLVINKIVPSSSQEKMHLNA